MNEKALTVHQPYAYLVCAGIKDIENRTWNTKYRGRVYIHASATDVYKGKKSYIQMTEDQIKTAIIAINSQCNCLYDAFLSKGFPDRTMSAIIGHVDIIDCVKDHPSIWALPDNYHWVLANPVLFEHPILNVKGKLSYWDCSEYLVLPDHISGDTPFSTNTEDLITTLTRRAYKNK